MKINTDELRKIIREELKKYAGPILKELVKETLLKNSINEVLLNLIAEAVVDKQEALQQLREQVTVETDDEESTFRVAKNLPPRNEMHNLTESERAEIKSKYEQMMGGGIQIPKNRKSVNANYIQQEQPQDSGEIDARRVLQMLPQTDTEGNPLRLNAMPEHLANALTKDYRQVLKNIHAVVNKTRH